MKKLPDDRQAMTINEKQRHYLHLIGSIGNVTKYENYILQIITSSDHISLTMNN
jgi:hypothetical protein